MHPHRPDRDAFPDKSPPDQRQVDMRNTRIGDSDHRLPPRQASSGLPQARMEPGTEYASAPGAGAQSYHHSKPPSHAASSSHANRSHDYRSWSPDRSHSEQSRPSHLQSYHPNRPYYDDYAPANSEPRHRGPYLDQRSPRDLSRPLHSSAYVDAQRRQQPYHEYAGHQQPAAHAFRGQPYAEHASQHPYLDARSDPRASLRPTLPSPRDAHRSAENIPLMGAFNSRDAYPADQYGHARYPPVTSAHEARPWPETIRYSDGPSRPSTSTSSDPAFSSSAPNKSTLPSRKRKKQFKYMLEVEAGDSTKPANDDAEKDELDADRADTVDAADGTDSAPQRKESRKKVKKACIFCKRSHMPCEEARPCKRCVKRGISHLCKDAEPASSSGNASSSKNKSEETRVTARAKQRKGSKDTSRTNPDQALDNESGSDSESLASSSAASSFHRRSCDMNVMPGAAARDPDYRPTMPVSMLCSPAGAELARRPAKRASSPGVSQKEQEEAWNRSMDSSTQTKMKQMLEAGNTARDLSDVFGEIPTSLLMTPAQANLPRGQSILRPASAGLSSSPPRSDPSEREQRLKRSLSMTLSSTPPHEVDEAGFKLPRRPRHLLQEEAATTSELRGGPPAYSYTYGYAKLARWMHTRFSRESCEQVDRALSVIRPKLMALSRSLPEAELIGVEDSFYQLLEFYTANVMETIPIPMILARRTGEIYAANSHACNLMQLPPSIFEGGQICHYQLVAEKDAVSMWQKYAKEARGELDSAPSQTVMLEVDRSLLLFDKPGFDPCTGELMGDGSETCEDGSAAVIRRKVIVTFEAKMSKHGLPFMVTGFIVPIPEDD